MLVVLQMKPYQPPKYFCDDLTPSSFPKVQSEHGIKNKRIERVRITSVTN
jgi:hypothetical protein